MDLPTIQASSIDDNNDVHYFGILFPPQNSVEEKSRPEFLRSEDISLWKAQGATFATDFVEEAEYYEALGEWITRKYKESTSSHEDLAIGAFISRIVAGVGSYQWTMDYRL